MAKRAAETPSTRVARTCGVCGASFLAYRSHVEGARNEGRYCSDGCRIAAQRGATRPRGARVERACDRCGATYMVWQRKLDRGTGRYCSTACARTATRGVIRPRTQLERACPACGATFRTIPSLLARARGRFCSRACAIRAWSGDRPRFVGYPQKRGHALHWRKAVLARDGRTCQRCGATRGPLHAHHIKPWKGFPELRLDLANGITLCRACHTDAHRRIKASGHQ